MFFPFIGHFTQVIWKNSKFLGQGAAKSINNTVYVVCNYDPPGNIIGQFKENVFTEITKTSTVQNMYPTNVNGIYIF